MYNEKVLKIFENPQNAGALRGANASGKVGNVQCGDIMQVFIKVDDGVITDARFKTFGCVSAIAASDVACELIKGKTLDQALALSNQDVVNFLGGLPAPKIHCSVLAKEAIEAAIKDFRKKEARRNRTATVTTKSTTSSVSTKKCDC